MDKSLIPGYLMEYLDGLVPRRPPEMQAMEVYAEKIIFPSSAPPPATCATRWRV